MHIAGGPNRLHFLLFILTVNSFTFYWIYTMSKKCNSTLIKFSWLPVILQLSRASSEKSLPISDCIWLSLSASTLICCFLQTVSVDVTVFRDRKEKREREGADRQREERGSAATTNWNPVAPGSRGVPQSWGFTRVVWSKIRYTQLYPLST